MIIGKKTCFYKKPWVLPFSGGFEKSSCGTPELPKVTPPALNMFSSPWHQDDREWQYANFAEVYNYLRGNRKLCIPPEWRGVIPSRLEWNKVARNCPVRSICSIPWHNVYRSFGSNNNCFPFFTFFCGKSRVDDFWVRQPVTNPWFSRDNPWFALKNLGFSGKPWFSLTHDQPMTNPWFTHDNPWFSGRKITG